MPHAAFYVVEPRNILEYGIYLFVSMPHAAFYVVEHRPRRRMLAVAGGFNAARGFLCGGTPI